MKKFKDTLIASTFFGGKVYLFVLSIGAVIAAAAGAGTGMAVSTGLIPVKITPKKPKEEKTNEPQ